MHRRSDAQARVAAIASFVTLVGAPPADGDSTSGGPAPSQRPIVVDISTGFDWGDAAIGAAAGFGVAIAAAGGLTLIRNR
jgi:hypothetical protein